MTNEIIIDGVNVAECVHYKSIGYDDGEVQIKNICKLYCNSHCIDDSDCYYKQLQREKGASVQHLKERDAMIEEAITYTNKINKLNQALAEIKEIAEYNARLPVVVKSFEQILAKIAEVENG